MTQPTLDEVKKELDDDLKKHNRKALSEAINLRAAGKVGREVTGHYISYLRSISGNQDDSDHGEQGHEGDDQPRQ